MKFSALIRLLFAPVIFTIFYLIFAISPAFAQTSSSPAFTPYTNPDVPYNSHTWTQTVLIEVLSAITCQIAGVDPINPNQKCLGVDPQSGKIGFVEGGGGAIGLANKMIALTFTPPLRTGEYVNYLANSFGAAKKAHAQGSGFKSLNPLLDIWKAFSNVVYLFFIIVFIVIGLAIMLRVKIDPRTVMSIENQIPKIIIGLVLVTFSFAIAGLLIDLMWVSIYFGYNIITNANVPGVDLYPLNPATMQGKVPFDAIGLNQANQISNNVALSIKGIIQQYLGITACPDISGIKDCTNKLFNPFNIFGDFVLDPNPINILFNIISGVSGAAVFFNIAHIPFASKGFLDNFAGIFADASKTISAFAAAEGAYAGAQLLLREFIPWLIAYLIIFIALLWALFRLWFILITSYIYILLDVALAPFWILAGLLPGSPIGFGAWFRDIAANLSAFPVTIGMFLLGKVFIDGVGKSDGDKFVPPLIGNPSDANFFSAIIGLGVILLTPQVVAMIKDAIKAPQFKYSAAIGQAVGVGPAVIGGVTHAAGPYGGLHTFGHIRRQLAGGTGPGGLGGLIGSLKKGVAEQEVLPPEKTRSR